MMNDGIVFTPAWHCMVGNRCAIPSLFFVPFLSVPFVLEWLFIFERSSLASSTIVFFSLCVCAKVFVWSWMPRSL